MRLLAKYTKEERVKYISHLDLMRTVHRALRRAEIPVAFSQGFNPHPKLSFASALSVGVTSEGEYMDIILEEPMPAEEAAFRLDNALPSGISIVKAVEIDQKAPSLMSLIERASYKITLLSALHFDLQSSIADFMNRSAVMVQKPGKKGKVEINLRTMVHQLELVNHQQGQVVLRTVVSSGSKKNLNPELLLRFLLGTSEDNPEEIFARIHRINLFLNHEGLWVTPLALGKECSLSE